LLADEPDPEAETNWSDLEEDQPGSPKSPLEDELVADDDLATDDGNADADTDSDVSMD